MTRSVFSETYGHLCSVLVQARKAKGLTQAEVAKRLQRPQSFVSKYEQGERRLDVIEFLEVADALGIRARSLISKLEDARTKREGRK